MSLLSKFVILTLAFIMSAAGARAEEKSDIHPTKGPAHVVLGNNLAEINLSKDFAFINKDDSAKLLKRMGESSEGILGIIVPTNDTSFEVYCAFDDTGYVSDKDANEINPDELLDALKEGTKSENDQRKLAGVPPFFVGNWADKPRYDKSRHQIVWAVTITEEDKPSAPIACINYNTRILGRRGVLSLNLVSPPDSLTANKQKIAAILNSTNFKKGESYADYQPGKDKDAGFGLAGLILGGGALAAAAKLGAFGGLWKFILAAVLILKKSVIAIVIAAVFFARKFFRRKALVAETVEGGKTDGQLPE